MHVALIIDGGYSGSEPTTVVEFIDDIPEIMRSGLGDLTPFEV
jgi:tRNA A37 threonylcarbamoyladenosine synthetase subunit TsaC/SUA5/YrdC